MSKGVKVVAGLVIAVIAVVAILVVVVFQHLAAIIKQVIEDVGSNVTGTPVRVQQGQFTLAEGREARFPDSVTERGRRHVQLLQRLEHVVAAPFPAPRLTGDHPAPDLRGAG